MKKSTLKKAGHLSMVMLAVTAALFAVGCSAGSDTVVSKRESIPFEEDQLYAVAYLGYEEMTELRAYQEKYLDEDTLPIHYFSGGEYYLIIPRFDDMYVCLYRNDLETMDKTLVYESDNCKPFIVQCNISDIFPDAAIELTYQGEAALFSPHISLRDGSIVAGERGLDLTGIHP